MYLAPYGGQACPISYLETKRPISRLIFGISLGLAALGVLFGRGSVASVSTCAIPDFFTFVNVGLEYVDDFLSQVAELIMRLAGIVWIDCVMVVEDFFSCHRALAPMKVSSTSTSPDSVLVSSACIASRIRWSMNHAVFCVTPMDRASS